ncbi:MAG: hypothetical protein JW819_05770 [Candidatus Krumholzibacteriota bacterium]|nr:hypothetical protein [Candidatus Krumholzibacteriota bacterium]
MTRRLITALLLAILAAPAAVNARADETRLWEDGKPEVILGVYFDEAGLDTLLEGEPPDTLTVYLVMWNAGTRYEGNVMALEYRVDLPEGLSLIGKSEVPEYTNLAMGSVSEGFTQAILDKPGDGLLVNTLHLAVMGPVAYDARIRVMPHPGTGLMRYVHRTGGPQKVGMHLMLGQDAIVNPKVTEAEQDWKPIRSR